MLSGRSPFYSKLRTDSASHVMRRIKEGDFRLEGEAWRYVTTQAKNLTKGLLTVDPRKRLSMDQLKNNSWIGTSHNNNQSGTLLTTSVLTTEPLERCLKQTYDAFHNVTREGFRLTPVASASSKLLQKRKLKQSLSSDASSVSDRSSFGSKSSSSSVTASKHWAEPAGTRATSTKDNVEIFRFKSGQVHQYLSGAGSPSHFPASLLTPLTVNVTAAPGFSSSSHAHAQYIQSLSSSASSASSSSVFAPYSNSVSLSLIHSNLNVINSSSVIQNVSHGFISKPDSSSSQGYHQQPHSQPQPSQDSGPLTRSRKRRLFDGEHTSDKVYEKNFGKTKVHRTGTIVIE